jgi:hypothetical protein
MGFRQSTFNGKPSRRNTHYYIDYIAYVSLLLHHILDDKKKKCQRATNRIHIYYKYIDKNDVGTYTVYVYTYDYDVSNTKYIYVFLFDHIDISYPEIKSILDIK